MTILDTATALTFDLVHVDSLLLNGMDVREYCDTSNPDYQNRSTSQIYQSNFARKCPGVGQTQAPPSFQKNPPLYPCYKRSNERAVQRRSTSSQYARDGNRETIERLGDMRRRGMPKTFSQSFLTHVNQRLNQEVQLDFFFFNLRQTKYSTMNLTDTVKSYSQMAVNTKQAIPIFKMSLRHQ